MSVATVKVVIDGKERDWPAEYWEGDFIGRLRGDDFQISRLVPIEENGWEFRETITGEWHGFRGRP